MVRTSRGVVEPIERLWSQGSLRGLDPQALWLRFTTHQDEEAFAGLVSHYGPMVHAVCRSVRGDRDAADDAFQATFVLLARKARSIRDETRLAGWLHRVARRLAVRAAVRSARQRQRLSLRQLGEDPPAPEPAPGLEAETIRRLHAEVDRLPATHRTAVVLCDLQGLTHQQAADQLRWPVGTVKGRLARARRTLRVRLQRQGIGASATIAAARQTVRVAPPPTLIDSTISLSRAASLSSAHSAALPAAIAALVKGESQLMTLQWLTAGSIACLTATGIGFAAYVNGNPHPSTPRRLATTQQPAQDEPKAGAPAPDQPAPLAISDDSLKAALARPLNTAERKDLIASRDAVELELEDLEFDVAFLRQRVIDAGHALDKAEDELNESNTGLVAESPNFDNLRRQRQALVEARHRDMKSLRLRFRELLERAQTLKAAKAAIDSQLEAPDAEPRRIKPGDVLRIELTGALPGRPVTGERKVQSDGTVSLGFYGSMQVAGLNRNQAKVAVIRYMKKYLTDEALGLVYPDQNGDRKRVSSELESVAVLVDDSSNP